MDEKVAVGRNPTNGDCFGLYSIQTRDLRNSQTIHGDACASRLNGHLKSVLQVKVAVALAWTVAELYLAASTLEVDNHIKDLTHALPSNNTHVYFE